MDCSFFREPGRAVSVNEVRYCGMISNFVWNQLEDMGLEEMRVQQDGATCHTGRETIDFLRQKFILRVICRNADVSRYECIYVTLSY